MSAVSFRISKALLASIVAVAALVIASPAMAQDLAAQAKQVLAQFKDEPTVRQVQNAAAAYAKVNPDAYSGWMTAASVAFLLPDRAKLRYEKDDDSGRDVRVTTGTGSLSELTTTDAEEILLVDVWWNFSRLIFNPDKIKISRQIQRIVDQREDILTTVNKIYFARREQQAQMVINPPTDIRGAVRRQLQIDALTADLDALTGGWFSRSLQR